MRFEVSQFIDVEDKIFGPLTWKQFVYVAGGAGAAVLCYIFLPFFLFLLIAGPIVALAAGLAFVPVNNRPLSHFLESVVRFAASHRLYLWGQPEAQPQHRAPEAPPSGNRLASLSRQLELRALKKESS